MSGRKPLPPIIEKVCRTCHETKPGDQFDRRDGGITNALYSDCKVCRREYQRRRREKIKNDKFLYRSFRRWRADYYQKLKTAHKELGRPMYIYLPLHERYRAIEQLC